MRGERAEIKPIKTEADHRAALAEIERLFDAKPDTPEGNRLEVLTTLVETYEDKHYSIPIPFRPSSITWRAGA